MRIAFLQDNHNHPGYTHASLTTSGAGGTESSVIHLATALARLGHDVFALNRLDTRSVEYGVTWVPLAMADAVPPCDIAVGVNSSRVLWSVRAKRTVVWLHNPPSTRAQLKRRTLAALLYQRPHAVMLGEYQSRLLHRLLPYAGRSILHHGIADDFFSPFADTRPRRPRAIFTSQPSRGLDFVVHAWRKISKAVPDAELHVFHPQARKAEAAALCKTGERIVLRGSVPRNELAHALRSARVMLIPGVADETFCLAAAEATASGVPIVTLGDGALSERVKHGATGLIASDLEGFTVGAVRLLTDDVLWMNLHRRCVSDPNLATWGKRAKEWQSLFETLLHPER